LGRDYHFTIGLSGLLGLAAFGVGLEVYRRFVTLGGLKNYTAPD
jgi:hypothetical protein